jgi:DNA-binding CsgD family transcriptional regulator
MVPADRDIIALIGYTQPIGLELLGTVVPYDVLEALEAQGLIINTVSGWRHIVELASPADPAALPGRVSLCQLRLRRTLAQALMGTGLRRAGDRFTLGRFQLDGIVKPDSETLCQAARYALDHAMAPMGLRLAEAAIKTGGGFAAALLRAEALAGTGKAHAAEEVFASLVPSTSEEIARLAAARARNLFRGLGRTFAARRVLTASACEEVVTDMLADFHRQCDQIPVLAAESTDPLERAKAALTQGKVRTAEHHFRQAWQQADSRAMVLQCLGGLVEVAALTGRAGEIESLGELAKAYAVEDCPIAALELAPAWLLAVRHDFAAARRSALDTARSVGRAKAVVAQALHLACRLGAATHGTDRLAALAGMHPLFEAYAAHAAALAARDLAGLESAAETFAGLGAKLYAAEAVAWAGAEHHRRGRLAVAARLAHRADEYLASCEGARSPCIRLAELAGLPRLTTREREVSGLAVGGLSNADIAARLDVSVRTVETHLSRSYHKLGVAGRDGLALALVGRLSHGHVMLAR